MRRDVRWHGPVVGLSLIVFTLVFYRNLLFVEAPNLVPWGSDTLGHVLKAEYLLDQLGQGNLYPDFFPFWYMGLQMLRYHPPLPYYLLAAIATITGDMVRAANWFIALCALGGAWGAWHYRRWLGWAPAWAGSLLFLIMPDNVRVALAEGNLPRVLSTALLPFALYALLRLLEEDGGRRHVVGLAVAFTLIVLSHAMMAAIYAVTLAGVALFLGVAGVTPARRVVLAIATVVVGLLLAGWWLLPSFTGGITALDREALIRAQPTVPLPHYLNPFARRGDPEALYVGASLLPLAVAGLWTRRRSGHSVAFTLVGLAGILITLPGFNQLFNALPLSDLLWPLRFLGVASFLLLLAVLLHVPAWWARHPLLAVGLMALVAADFAGSLSLIHLRPLREDVRQVARELAALPGWRQATIDESRLGSAAAYAFTAIGRREQLYGWAYQGARTARNVAAINEALSYGSYEYVLDRLRLYGVDDVVLLTTLPYADELSRVLRAEGFEAVYEKGALVLFHREGRPRAYVISQRALGIGRGARLWAFLFPQVIVGTSPYVDDYALDELRRYDVLLLSGFAWRDREAAERLVEEVAQSGVRVIVDLTGVPVDPTARIPRFLNVWGEQIILDDRPVIAQVGAEEVPLRPFAAPTKLWYTHVPQGVDVETITFDYLGERGTVVGYRQVGKGRVWFVGLNLSYHALTTGDETALRLLADVVGLEPRGQPASTAVSLADYQTVADGYRFRYTLGRPAWLLLPVAAFDGTRLFIDGVPADARSLEMLVLFEAPAGTHTVDVRVGPAPIYRAGQGATFVGVLLLAALVWWAGRTAWAAEGTRRHSGHTRVGVPEALPTAGGPSGETP